MRDLSGKRNKTVKNEDSLTKSNRLCEWCKLSSQKHYSIVLGAGCFSIESAILNWDDS